GRHTGGCDTGGAASEGTDAHGRTPFPEHDGQSAEGTEKEKGKRVVSPEFTPYRRPAENPSAKLAAALDSRQRVVSGLHLPARSVFLRENFPSRCER
ncbi:hypothetical protein, partial [Streptomyces clavuligerus]